MCCLSWSGGVFVPLDMESRDVLLIGNTIQTFQILNGWPCMWQKLLE